VAALAPHVLNAAREGEAVAQRTVDEAARELVELVVMLERHFAGTAPLSVAVTGGLLLPQSPLTTAFRERLAAGCQRARLVAERIDAALGALQLATELV
jgi:N-acetylglucosamine kinase-like BadF-type ATPase